MAQAEFVKAAIGRRLQECGMEMHPEKTRIVYCKDGKRRGPYEPKRFVFLGYEFRARSTRTKDGKRFDGFNPAISPEEGKAHPARDAGLAPEPRGGTDLDGVGPVGQPQSARVDQLLWSVLPLRVVRQPQITKRAPCSLGTTQIQAAPRTPRKDVPFPESGSRAGTGLVRSLDHRVTPKLDSKSRVTGVCHARFRESRGVRLPTATRHFSGCVR